ncbi:hypothetical protein LCGC14_2007870, partial [marine sediment metagenome]
MGEEKSSPFTHPVGHKEEKVWGSWEILAQGLGYQIKLLVFNPGAEMSLQLHRYREEFWTVIYGRGTAWIGDKHDISLSPSLGSLYRVRKLQPHRIRVDGHSLKGLGILELQKGDYLGEDDLIRIS